MAESRQELEKILNGIDKILTEKYDMKINRKKTKVLQLSFRNRNSALKEKDEIIAWRRRYLRQITTYREEGRKIYYLDETWLNAGHTVGKVWVDKTVLTASQAFINGLSTGLKHPSGKDNRLIILHIGSAAEFVENGLLLFESNKSGDYHEEMDAEVFEKWFPGILPALEENSVIVMDNASYHSRILDKCHKKKNMIQLWLSNHNIPFTENMVKAELLDLVKKHRPQTVKFTCKDREN